MAQRLLSVVLIISAFAHTAAAQNSPRVDSLFAPWGRVDSPGAVVAVLKNGETVHMAGYGMANLDYGIPLTGRTVFDIASVSKQFCAFAIAVLAERGLLTLDDDVRTFIPELPSRDPPITIRQLVHHTSGLRDWPGSLAMASWNMEDVISFGQILRFAQHQESLNFAPGSEYSYSNTGYNLLAEVVARVSGQSFRAWMDENVFKPLGMVHTHFRDDHEEPVANRAVGYSPAEENYKVLSNKLTALGSSSLFSTAEDLVRWTQNFRRPLLGSPAVHKQMEERGMLASGQSIPYAFGQVHGTYRGLNSVGHSGSWAGFRTVLLRFPDSDFAVVILSNVATFQPLGMAFRIADIYLESALTPPELDPISVNIHPGDLLSAPGLYRLGAATFVRISRVGTLLVWQATNEPEHPMIPLAETTFFVKAYGDSVRFRGTSGGRAQEIMFRKAVAPRVPETDVGDMTAYAGKYWSPDLEASVTIILEDGQLRALQRRSGSTTLQHVTGDVFTTTRWYMPVIEFKRNGQEKVMSLEMSTVRSRRERFLRQE